MVTDMLLLSQSFIQGCRSRTVEGITRNVLENHVLRFCPKGMSAHDCIAVRVWVRTLFSSAGLIAYRFCAVEVFCTQSHPPLSPSLLSGLAYSVSLISLSLLSFLWACSLMRVTSLENDQPSLLKIARCPVTQTLGSMQGYNLCLEVGVER